LYTTELKEEENNNETLSVLNEFSRASRESNKRPLKNIKNKDSKKGDVDGIKKMKQKFIFSCVVIIFNLMK